MIAWRRTDGMRPKGHNMGKGPSVYKGDRHKKTASNQDAAPSDPRAAVLTSQETDVRIQHDPELLLPVARVHARVHWGGGYSGC